MATKLQTLKANTLAAIKAYQDYTRTTPNDPEILKGLQANVTAAQQLYSAGRKSVQLALDGTYPVSYKGAVVGSCVVKDGEPIFTFNTDQSALVTKIASTALTITVGGSGTVVSGELTGFTGGTIYLVD